MIKGGVTPVQRAQAPPFYPSLSPSSSQDQRVGDGNRGGPSLTKPEASMAARVWGPSDSHFLAAGDGDNYGMGWMSSKMRFIQRMKKTNSNNDPNHRTGPTTNDSKTTDVRVAITMNGGGGSNHVTMVCYDCNTTTSPLWRSGPRGPKSLCNACGIRQRKARRAMEEAAATTGGFHPPSSSVTSRINGSKVHNKEKKSHRAGHSVLGPTCKKITKMGGSEGDGLFGDFSVWRGAFPREVTEAAILLMDLSCGIVHT